METLGSRQNEASGCPPNDEWHFSSRSLFPPSCKTQDAVPRGLCGLCPESDAFQSVFLFTVRVYIHREIDGPPRRNDTFATSFCCFCIHEGYIKRGQTAEGNHNASYCFVYAALVRRKRRHGELNCRRSGAQGKEERDTGHNSNLSKALVAVTVIALVSETPTFRWAVEAVLAGVKVGGWGEDMF